MRATALHTRSADCEITLEANPEDALFSPSKRRLASIASPLARKRLMMRR